MIFLCGIMSPKKLTGLVDDGPGPRVTPPPSYDKLQFCPVPQIPIHPLHRLDAELPEIPTEEQRTPLFTVAAVDRAGSSENIGP
jgi:hypothetical protein